MGLVAALLLAVSPVDVATAHRVRPDVVLGAFVLLALLAFDALERPSGDAVAGLSLGLAAVVKFTRALLVASHLLRRWLTPGRRLRGAFLAGLVATPVALAATPYALLRTADFERGAHYQLMAHYKGGGAAPGWIDNVGFYLRTAEQGLGPVGALLAVCGLLLAVRAGHRWLPALLFLVVLVTVMSSAELRFPRFLVPASGIWRCSRRVRWRGVGVAAVLLAAMQPISAAGHFALKSARPSPRDEARDWIQAHVRPGARIPGIRASDRV